MMMFRVFEFVQNAFGFFIPKYSFKANLDKNFTMAHLIHGKLQRTNDI